MSPFTFIVVFLHRTVRSLSIEHLCKEKLKLSLRFSSSEFKCRRRDKKSTHNLHFLLSNGTNDSRIASPFSSRFWILNSCYAVISLVFCTIFKCVFNIKPYSFHKRMQEFIEVHYNSRARGSLVVKALRYKPAGRGFDSRWCHWNFSVT